MFDQNLARVDRLQGAHVLQIEDAPALEAQLREASVETRLQHTGVMRTGRCWNGWNGTPGRNIELGLDSKT